MVVLLELVSLEKLMDERNHMHPLVLVVVVKLFAALVVVVGELVLLTVVGELVLIEMLLTGMLELETELITDTRIDGARDGAWLINVQLGAINDRGKSRANNGGTARYQGPVETYWKERMNEFARGKFKRESYEC